MKLSDIKSTDKLWVVYYEVIGSRSTGTYLVNARTKGEANKIVKALDRDYVRFRAVPLEVEAEEMGMSVEEYVGSKQKPAPGKATHLESGT